MKDGIPVRYNPLFGAFSALAGGLILLAGLLLGDVITLGIGAMNLLLGLGFMTQPVFVVFDRRIEVRNLLGMTLRKHHIRLHELEVREGKVHPRNGSFRGLGGWVARRSDLAKIDEAIRGSVRR